MASCLGLLARRSRPRVTELETTTSTCATEAVRRNHVFQIQGYTSLLGRTGACESVRSAAFEAGGYDWAVRYYPHGCQHASPGYASVFVELLTPGTTARASCEVTLLPVSRRAGAAPPPPVYRKGPRLFCRNNDAGGSKAYLEGCCSFVKRKRVEEPTFLGDDTIRIQCAVTVLKEPTNFAARPVKVTPPAARVKVPPSDLASDLAKLLDPKADVPPADVTVFVGEEAFAAHSFMLWARCRTLYDRMTGWAIVKISEYEVRPVAFKALLHYIYTDSLPAMDDLDAAGKVEMLQQLLVAAHLYGVERLKLMCERTLCTSLQAGTVVATLALAEHLHCPALRGACIQFISSTA